VRLARARGMSEIAKASGLAREALYKALKPDAQPRFDTMARVRKALRARLVAVQLDLGIESGCSPVK
jgi:probable addiction module antidote protein